MCAANVESFTSWSTTLTSNQPTGTDTADIISDLTKIQAEVRKYVATKGADIASATTTDLANATGNYVHITGTTTITGLGTVSAGVRFLLVFDGILTFTHNATSLILPTGANITTAAGDRCEVVSLGSGNFRCLWYQRASGVPLDAELAAIAGLTSAANKVPRFTGDGTAELIDVVSGTYTPTITGTLNVASVAPTYDFLYSRVGSMVTVSGIITLDVTAGSTQTAFTITLPVASDFDSVGDASGTINSSGATANGFGYASASVADNVLVCSITSGTSVSATAYICVVQYIIK